MWNKSINDPEAFWGKVASEFTWKKKVRLDLPRRRFVSRFASLAQHSAGVRKRSHTEARVVPLSHMVDDVNAGLTVA